MRTVLLFLLLLPQTLKAQECLAYPVHAMGLPVTRDLTQYAEKTLPVVFHIVHTGGETNISDAQVLSQMDVLQEAYRTQAVDTRIDFCLAARDPEGNPTTGITRTNGAAIWPLYAEEGISNGSANSAGVDQALVKEVAGCWNPDEYINIYIVSEINDNDGGYGVQGFAYQGPTYDCRDGIVTLYNATGNVGTLKPGRTLGWTIVHEIGHHLTLWHTFANSNDCEETNCDSQGDQVCDTPTTLQNTSCTEVECPDALLENFMDYTPETCKYSFTEGQAERMHNGVENLRPGLLSSLACVPVTDYDATVYVAYYQEEWCTAFQDIWVDVVNQGSLPLDSVEVVLTCAGQEYTQTLTNLLGTQTVAFEGVAMDGADGFTVEVYSTQDENAGNDLVSFPLQVTNGDLVNIIVTTDIWANETSWELTDENGYVLTGDGGYPFGVNTYTYNVCIYDGCYTVTLEDSNGDGFCSLDNDADGTCDYGPGYFLAMAGTDTLVYVPEGSIFSTLTETFCNTTPACPLDFDGNGIVGNGDLLVMLANYGCVSDCEGDTNGDGVVNVEDLIEMLSAYGSCGSQLTPPQTKQLTTEQIYDLWGRPVAGSLESLAPGVYIVTTKEGARKVFVQ